jgi:hypothetical protein
MRSESGRAIACRLQAAGCTADAIAFGVVVAWARMRLEGTGETGDHSTSSIANRNSSLAKRGRARDARKD